MKKTLNTLLHYPPLILTPVFSIWTFGPPGPGFQCKRQNMIKISWFLTWGNLILNTIEIMILIGIAYQNRHSQFLDHTWTASIEIVRSCKDFSDFWGYLSKKNWKTPKIGISELVFSLLVTLTLLWRHSPIRSIKSPDANFWEREVPWVRFPQ